MQVCAPRHIGNTKKYGEAGKRDVRDHAMMHSAFKSFDTSHCWPDEDIIATLEAL